MYAKAKYGTKLAFVPLEPAEFTATDMPVVADKVEAVDVTVP